MPRNRVCFRPDVEGLPRIVCLDAGIAATPAVITSGPVDIQDPPLPSSDYVPPQAADHAIANDGADRSAVDITTPVATIPTSGKKDLTLFAGDPGMLFAKPIPSDVTMPTDTPPTTIPTQVTAQLPVSSPAPVNVTTGPPMTCAFPVDAVSIVLSGTTTTSPDQPQMDV